MTSRTSIRAEPNFVQNMSHTLPPMMHVLKDVAGIETADTLLKQTEPEARDGQVEAVAATN